MAVDYTPATEEAAQTFSGAVTISGALTLSSNVTSSLDVSVDSKYAVVGQDATTGMMVLGSNVTATAVALQTNTFATAFGAAPVVTCTYTEAPGITTNIYLGTITASNFICTVAPDKNFSYIAIGSRP